MYDKEGEDMFILLIIIIIKLLLLLMKIVGVLSSSFLARRSWSLKLGFFGPIVSVIVVVVGRRWACWAARREGRVMGSFWADGSSDAPVSF